eukprot:11165124-Karenia_brevis.AAC.1
MCGLDATAGHASSPASRSYPDHASPGHIDAIVHDSQCGEGAPAIVEHMCRPTATAGHEASHASPVLFDISDLTTSGVQASPVLFDAIAQTDITVHHDVLD